MKRHHYLPQVYLRQFENPHRKRQLWQYSKVDGSIQALTPKECGCADYYHSITTENGRDDDSLEKSFHSQENKLPALFEALRHQRQLGETEWLSVFWMISLHMVRVPKYQASLGSFMSEVLRHAFRIQSQNLPEFRAVCDRAGMSADPSEAAKGLSANPELVLQLALKTFPNMIRVGALSRRGNERHRSYGVGARI